MLKKGHNNEVSLPGCGEKTAESYLKSFSIFNLKHAVLNAFIYGIDKTKYKDVSRNVKGLGLTKGISTFADAFRQSYLLRTLEEVKEVE